MTEPKPWRSLRRPAVAALTVALLVVLTGCAGSNDVAGTGQDLAGFWPGLWHGFILPVSLIISWFNSSVGIYEVHNNGGWYDTGFVLGASFVFGSVLGGSRGAATASRRRG
ncbi:hypothetical protein [Nocardioides cynanchi]|uniref:hypothetical protein n=1 Tax=Nocardioides cynanchi TaxID=2558918 RepID=UPI00124607C4|nr:hypothetical protein [Nocardioides cynanchi]